MYESIDGESLQYYVYMLNQDVLSSSYNVFGGWRDEAVHIHRAFGNQRSHSCALDDSARAVLADSEIASVHS